MYDFLSRRGRDERRYEGGFQHMENVHQLADLHSRSPREHDDGPSGNVLIAGRHPIFLEGLATVVRDNPNLTLTGVFTSIQESVRSCLRAAPDLILSDACLTDGSAADLALVLRYQAVQSQYLIFTADESDETLLHLHDLGLQNFLHKTEATRTRILEAIGEILNGAAVTSAVALARVLKLQRAAAPRPTTAPRPQPVESLTARELEVLVLMQHGFDNQAMAAHLGVSYVTIRSHIQHILGKLEAHSQLEAVARAAACGLLPNGISPSRLPAA
jgi:DNA-binding NarL/FixJ family response regulator